MTNQELTAQWQRYSGWRWLGIGLFCVALPGPPLAVGAIVMKGASLKLIPLSMLTLGLSLGSFGTANDTAVHALRELAHRGAPVPAAAELTIEQEHRPARLAELHDSPKAALILPLIAAGLWCTQAFIYLHAW